MNLFHKHKKINNVLEVNYTCYCKDKPSGIDSSETFFFVKVGNLWIHSAKFEGKYLHDSMNYAERQKVVVQIIQEGGARIALHIVLQLCVTTLKLKSKADGREKRLPKLRVCHQQR